MHRIIELSFVLLGHAAWTWAGCPTDWTEKTDGNCYGVVTRTNISSAYDARVACLSFGADLPDVSSSEVNTIVHSLVNTPSNPPEAIYLAQNDIGIEGTFKNGANGTADYTNWEEGHPDNSTNNDTNCVIMARSNSKWYNVDCCTSQNITVVVCQKPLDSDFTFPPDDDIFAKECFGDIDDCAGPNHCKHGGTCIDHVTYYECACAPGYEGRHCEDAVNLCEPSPCENGRPCTPDINSYSCDCGDWFSGENCSQVISLCHSNPCKNNATCLGDMATYNCSCQEGFEGSNCEDVIQGYYCIKLNISCGDGSCVDDGTTPSCQCDEGYKGDSCEEVVVCPDLPSVANATAFNATGAPYLHNAEITFTCNAGKKFADMTTTKTVRCEPSGWEPTPIACEPHCSHIPAIGHTVIANGNTRMGNVVNFTCELGYQFPDNTTFLNITCEEGRKWSIAENMLHDCQVVKCPKLPTPKYQERDTNNNTYDTTVTFWCEVGYTLHDQTTARTIKCLHDGEWTAQLPDCQPVRCPPIPDMPGLNTTENTYDTYAEYECEPGKRMLDGAAWRVTRCEATGNWSDIITECSADRCNPLPYVANATPSDTDANLGNVVELTCIKGHRFDVTTNPVEKKSMTCQPSSKRWDPVLQSCEPIICEALTAPTHATLSTTERLFSTRVNATCNVGYYYNASTGGRVNVQTVECMEDGSWDKPLENTCQAVPCPPTPDIYNGSRSGGSSGYVFPDKVEYNCDPGFKFADGRLGKFIACTATGQWDDVDTSCRRDRCDPVPTADFVIPDTTNTSWYTDVHYSCKPGYEWVYPLNIINIITCLNTGDWNTTRISMCKAKQCPPMLVMQNATKNITTNPQFFDTILEHQCDTGFKFPDNETAKLQRCNEDGQWEPADDIFPRCQIIYCPDLGEVENATRMSNDTHYNTNVSFVCDDGYQYPDKTRDKSILCTENGTWTQYPPSCEVVFCPPLPTAWSEIEFNSTLNEFGAVVMYWCRSNYSFGLYDASGERMIDVNGKKLFEPMDTTKLSICTEEKVWSPGLSDCLETVGIADDLKGVVYESPEAIPIGTTATILLCLMLAVIILLDLNKIFNDLCFMIRNVKHCCSGFSTKIKKSNSKVASQESLQTVQ